MAKRAFVKSPTKAMGPRGSLHKALGKKPGVKLGVAELKKVAAGNGPNAKKAALALTLNKEWGKK